MKRSFVALTLAAVLASRALAGVGDWVGYERIEERLRLRLFQGRPGCDAPVETREEYRRLAGRATLLTPGEFGRYQQLEGELTIKPGFVLGGVIGDFQPRLTSFAQLLGSRFQPAFEAFLMESSHAVNALNTFAWELTLRHLAGGLGKVCAQVTEDRTTLTLRSIDPTLSIARCRVRDVPLRPELQRLLGKLCRPDLYTRAAELRETLEEFFSLVTGDGEPDEEQEAWIEESMKAEYRHLAPTDRVGMMFRTIFLNPYFLLQH